MSWSFFSRKKPVNVPANKSVANAKEAANKALAIKASKKEVTKKAVTARMKKLSTNAKYNLMLNRLSLADPVFKKSRRLRKLKDKATLAKSNLSIKINDFQHRGKGTQKNVENAQNAYNRAYQNIENFVNADFVESNSSPTKPSPFKKSFSELMKERNNAYIASKGATVGKLLDLSKDLPISQENQKLLNEASNDDLEQQVAALNETPNELEQQVAALNEAPNELEQQVAALSSESEDESPVVKSTRRFPKRTPFYSGRRSLKSRRGRTSFSPKFIENYESSHPNYISPENMDTYRKYMLKVRPYNIGSVQNRSVNLNPTLNEERADTLLAKKLSKSPSPRSPSPRSPSPRLPSPRPPSPRSPSPRSPSPRPPSPIPVQLTPEQRYLAQKLSNARHVLRSAMSRSKVDGKGYLVEEEALLAAYIKFELSRMK
jgi:hypothetical protein